MAFIQAHEEGVYVEEIGEEPVKKSFSERIKEELKPFQK